MTDPPNAAAHAPPRPATTAADRRVVGLATLFGLMYFAQGICEPTQGLISQPVMSLLKGWGYPATEISALMALLALPWSFKPVYGLLTDFVPLWGTRRRSYLLLTSAATAIGLGTLYLFPPHNGMYSLLLLWLVVPTMAVAFSDVVVDALMVEEGQPRGLTGLLQSVQWASIYAATILTTRIGGILSEHSLQHLGFLICAVFAALMFVLCLLVVRERRGGPDLHSPVDAAAPRSMREAVRMLWDAASDPPVLVAGGFLFLWSFNPFSASVQYYHMTEPLGMSEQFYGTVGSWQAAAAVVAAIAFGFYCRRVPFRWLIHLSILTGVLTNLGYWGLRDERSALWIGMATGATYMTALLIQLDLAARTCNPATAGTTFALLMSLSNLSVSISEGLGGWLYDHWTVQWGHVTAFNVLVGFGALLTSSCWLLVPVILRRVPAR